MTTRPSRDSVSTAVVLAVIAFAALAISAGTLAALMQRLGWPLWQALLLPVAVDVLAGLAVWLWLGGRADTDTARLGRTVAWSALGVSVLGNAIEHVASAPAGLGWAILNVGFSSVPPVAFFVAVHMRARKSGIVLPSRRSSTRPARRAGDVSQPAVESHPAGVDVRGRPVELHAVGDGGDLARVRALDEQHRAEHGRPISRDKLRAELGIGNRRAGELLQVVKAEREGVAA